MFNFTDFYLNFDLSCSIWKKIFKTFANRALQIFDSDLMREM